MGMACPLGVKVDHVWARVLDGDSGIVEIESETNCKIGGPMHSDFWDEELQGKYVTSFGPEAKTYTLANYVTSQALSDSPKMMDHLDSHGDRIGCIIASQYGVQTDATHGKLELVKRMPHIIPSVIALKHGFRGHISAPSLSSGAGLAALG